MIRHAIHIILALAFGALVMITPPALNLISKYNGAQGCSYDFGAAVNDAAAHLPPVKKVKA